MEIKFINNSNLNIMVDFVNTDKKILIEPKTYIVAKCDKFGTFQVNEINEQNTICEKILGVIVSAVISIALWFVNYFDANSNSIEQLIKFDTKFEIDKELLKEKNTVIISESKAPYILFDAVINDCKLKGVPNFTKEKFNDQFKSYKQSKMIACFFPALILLLLFTLSVYVKNVVACVVVLCIAFFMLIYEYRKLKKDKEKIRHFVEKITMR